MFDVFAWMAMIGVAMIAVNLFCDPPLYRWTIMALIGLLLILSGVIGEDVSSNSGMIEERKQEFQEMTQTWQIEEAVTPNSRSKDDPKFDPREQVYRVRRIRDGFVEEGVLFQNHEGYLQVVNQRILGPVEEVMGTEKAAEAIQSEK